MASQTSNWVRLSMKVRMAFLTEASSSAMRMRLGMGTNHGKASHPNDGEATVLRVVNCYSQSEHRIRLTFHHNHKYYIQTAGTIPIMKRGCVTLPPQCIRWTGTLLLFLSLPCLAFSHGCSYKLDCWPSQWCQY